MLEYQKLAISDFSGGITDEFKSSAPNMFERLDNITLLSNGSAKIRNGTAPLVDCVSEGVSSMAVVPTRQAEYMFAVVRSGINYRKAIGAMANTTVPSGYDSITANRDISSAIRWRNFMFSNTINGPLTGTREGFVERTAILANGAVRTERAALPAVTGTNVGRGAGDRLYAVCVVRETVDVDGFTYRDYSPEYLGKFSGSISVSNPTLSHSLTAYHDTSDIKYVLFVTLRNGTSLYLADENSSGSLDYNGTAANDDALQSKERAFFLSEEPKMPIPKCDFFTIVNNTGWYLSIIEDGVRKPNRLWQSVQGMPTSVISSAYKDMTYNANGIGSINSLPVVLTDNAVYRIEGSIGIDGSGSLREIAISGSEGGISHNSIVEANGSLYYAGTDGFYVTDGYSAKNISGAKLYETYSKMIANKNDWQKIHATFDRDNNVIYWRMNDMTVFSLHLNSNGFTKMVYPDDWTISSLLSVYGEPSKMLLKSLSATQDGSTWLLDADTTKAVTMDMRVTVNSNRCTVSGVDRANNIVRVTPDVAPSQPSDLEGTVYGITSSNVRQLMIGMDTKTIIVSNDGILSETAADMDGIVAATLWEENPILWDIYTAGLPYGDPITKKWVKSLSVSAESFGRTAFEPYVRCDRRGEEASMKRIVNPSSYSLYDSQDLYGRKSKLFVPKTVVSSTRHLPRGKVRCRTNQLGLRASSADMYASEDYGQAQIIHFDSSARVWTAELVSTAAVLPTDFAHNGNTITIRPDGHGKYSNFVNVVERINDTTFKFMLINNIPIDAGDKVDGAIVDGTVFDWVVDGMPARQSAEFFALVVTYALIGETGSGNQRTDDARND